MNSAQLSEESIFQVARMIESPDARKAYLAQTCGRDEALLNRVHALLEALAQEDSFLDPTIGDIAQTLGQPIRESAGSMVGRYKLLQQIGEGGFGVVYMAEQEKPVKRRVALKVIKAGMDTKAVIARFEAERQALAMMDHPNIARVLDAGATDNGRPYFVMELVKGIPITDYCDQANLDTPNRLELFKDVCSAVQHAHQKGVIHRDLKPSNIMVTLHDGKPVVKVIDFGIAKATDQKLTEKTLFTNYGQMIGTPAYMSPEQAVMSGLDVDTRSDVYSLGVLLYELLTGGPPFDAKTLLTAGYDEMRRIIREQEPPKPSTRLDTLAADAKLTIAARRHVSPAALSKQLRGDLDWIVMKALEKDRARRYESASAFAQDIDRHLTAEPVDAAAPSAGYRLRKFAKRNKGPMAVAATIALLLLVGTAMSSWQAIRASRAENVARDAAQRAEDEAQRALDEARRATTAEALAKDEAVRATTAEKLAKDRLAEVAAERDAKDQARKDAEDISKFLGEIFQSPDPTRDGRTITVAETLDNAAKKLETDLADQPETRTKLQSTLGRTYHALGLARQAIPLQEKVRDYFLKTHGPGKICTLTAMHELGLSYARAGRLDDAIKLEEETLSRFEKENGPEDTNTLSAMSTLATYYHDAGRLHEALKIREQVKAIRIKAQGIEHPDTLLAMHNLAISYSSSGLWEEGLKINEQVMPLMRKIYGPEHPTTLTAMNSLAGSYDEADRPQEALKLMEELHKLRQKVLGSEHPHTLTVMNNLAIAYLRVERFDDGIKLGEEALQLSSKVNGPDHPQTLTVMSSLASLYSSAQKVEEAIKLGEPLVVLAIKVKGPEHPDTLGEMTNLAVYYLGAGRLDEAIKLQEKTLAIKRRVLPKTHPYLHNAILHMAILYRKTGRDEESAKLRAELKALKAKK